MSETIQCGSCSTRMRLSSQLLAKIVGRTGKITCKVCASELRLDFRGAELQVVTESVSSSNSAAMMLTRPPQRLVPPPQVEEEETGLGEYESTELRSVIPSSVLPPPLPRTHVTSGVALPAPSLEELARLSASRPAPLPLVRKRISSRPAPPLASSRPSLGSLTPHVWGEDSALTHLGVADDSSPYSASVPDAEVNALYAHLSSPKKRPSAAQVLSASSSSSIALGPKKSSPPHPPRPWEIETKPLTSSEPPPFERFGLSAAPPMPTQIVLTADGRLENEADRPLRASSSRRPRPALWAVLALFGGVLGAAAAQPEVRAWWGASQPGVESVEARSPGVKEPSALAARTSTGIVEGDRGAPTREPVEETISEIAPVVLTAPLRATPTNASSSSRARASVASSPRVPREDSTAQRGPSEPGPFQTQAASVALNTATAHASACRKEGDPSGTARVVVTFAPSGRATSATLSGPPFSGTETGSCIASRFRGARVPAFAGDYVTVTKTVVIQ